MLLSNKLRMSLFFKTATLIVLFVSAGFCCHAQDTIFVRNGKTICTKILEVTENKIKFTNRHHKTNYIRLKHTIAIVYTTGGQQVFKKTPPEPYRGVVETDYQYSVREANERVKRGYVMLSIGGLLCSGSAAVIGFGIGANNNPMGAAMAFTLGPMIAATGVALCIGGPVYIHKNNRKIKSLERFKSELSFAPALSPALNGAGIGMALKF